MPLQTSSILKKIENRTIRTTGGSYSKNVLIQKACSALKLFFEVVPTCAHADGEVEHGDGLGVDGHEQHEAGEQGPPNGNGPTPPPVHQRARQGAWGGGVGLTGRVGRAGLTVKRFPINITLTISIFLQVSSIRVQITEFHSKTTVKHTNIKLHMKNKKN